MRIGWSCRRRGAEGFLEQVHRWGIPVDSFLVEQYSLGQTGGSRWFDSCGCRWYLKRIGLHQRYWVPHFEQESGKRCGLVPSSSSVAEEP